MNVEFSIKHRKDIKRIVHEQRQFEVLAGTPAFGATSAVLLFKHETSIPFFPVLVSAFTLGSLSEENLTDLRDHVMEALHTYFLEQEDEDSATTILSGLTWMRFSRLSSSTDAFLNQLNSLCL